MVVLKVFLASLLLTQVLSAPSGCIESCTYHQQYQSHVSGIEDHVGSSHTASRLQGLDFSRPGTWSEHNDYNIDNGHGQVHEEHGQLVEGPKTVRFYKKNYTSSYTTGYSGGAGVSNIQNMQQQSDSYRYGMHVPSTDDILNSQRTYSKIRNSDSTAQQQHNRINSQQLAQSLDRRTNTQSERLEDFGEYSGNSHVVQQGVSDVNAQVLPGLQSNTQPGNWSTVDSYKTDGGNGHVFEEEGQYVAGPKKVRYYKRNYTSSYSSSNGNPVPDVANIGIQDIHKKIEKLHSEIGKGFSEISTAQNVGSSSMGQAYLNVHDVSSDNLHSINSNYKGQDSHRSSLSTRHHNEHIADSAHEQLSYTNPSQSTYGTNSYSVYERHEGHATQLQPSSQLINPTSGYTNVLSTGSNGYHRNMFNSATSQRQTDSLQQVEHLDTHQSRVVQNKMLLDNLRSNANTENIGIHSVRPGQAAHYKEHWSAGYTKETSVPQYSSDISHMNQEMHQYNGNQYENRYNSHQTTAQQGSYLHQFSGTGINSARNTPFGKLITGALDLNQGEDTVDCAHDATHTRSSSQYHRKYKRSADYNIQDDMEEVRNKHFDNDFTQQTGQFDDLTQQTSEDLDFGQKSQETYQPWEPNSASHKLEDLTQQTGGFDDFTQQTSGKLELGQESEHTYQPWTPSSANQKLEDLTQQTGSFDDLVQQTSGKLELGQEPQQNYQLWKPNSANKELEDLTQQTGGFDDFTHQTSGKLELGQEPQQNYQPWKPNSANKELEDLTQHTAGLDDLTQQTSGKLELEQESQQNYQPWKPNSANKELEDLTQQTAGLDDLVQQTSGKVELGQESQQNYQPWTPNSANQELGDLTQQTGGFDDFTQQTSGKLELGQEPQQNYQPWKANSANKELEDLTQQTAGLDDLVQQTSGKLELGQESQQNYQPWTPNSANQELGDLTQQTAGLADLVQQTSGKLELGQESQQNYQPWTPNSANQELGDLTQQTGGFDDFTQQTSGKLELGQEPQQNYQPWKPNSANKELEDLAQQTGSFDDLVQQTSGKLELGQEPQQNYQPWKPNSANKELEDLTQQTAGLDDLVQQTSGKFDLEQESQQNYQPWKPNSADLKLEGLSQQTDNLPFQQTPNSHLLKPAEKPKPRSRYSRFGSAVTLHTPNENVHVTYNLPGMNHNSADTSAPAMHELSPQVDTKETMDSTRNQNIRGDQELASNTNKDSPRNINQHTDSSGYDTEGGSGDQVSWLHKSNDATVGLQWHYTYHPSDQRQLVQQTDQKNKEGMQQQLQQNLGQSTQNQYTSEDPHQQSGYNGQYQNHAAVEGVKTAKRKQVHFQEENKFTPVQQGIGLNDNSEKNTQTKETMHQLEPRILEAYGVGQYDPYHAEDIYSRVRVNPSATLPPISDVDPWYIREKPKEVTTEESTPPLPVEPLDVEDITTEGSDINETTTPSSVWSRLGHKITSTIDKAKERARVIFG